MDLRPSNDWKVVETLKNGVSRRLEVTGDVSAKGTVGHRAYLFTLLLSNQEVRSLIPLCTQR